jgi:hypothetical protein
LEHTKYPETTSFWMDDNNIKCACLVLGAGA